MSDKEISHKDLLLEIQSVAASVASLSGLALVVDRIDARLVGVEGRLVGVEQRLANVEQHTSLIPWMADAISNLSGTSDEHEKQLKRLKGQAA